MTTIFPASFVREPSAGLTGLSMRCDRMPFGVAQQRLRDVVMSFRVHLFANKNGRDGMEIFVADHRLVNMDIPLLMEKLGITRGQG